MRSCVPSRHSSNEPAPSPVARARKLNQRSDERKAYLLLRQACFSDEADPRLWVHFGLQCLRVRRRDEGLQALRQALWLRERAREHQRARVLRELIEHVSSGGTLPNAA
jgi:Flp pilus assembly protein TadD